jgi:hypothetical protein
LVVKIGELLVQNGLITDEQLDEALKAQLVFGGRLGTNLVELGHISTTTLAEFLSKQLAMPALAPSQLEKIPTDVIGAVSPDLASKYMMFPLALEGRALTLGMADPTDLAAVDEISFTTGLQVKTIVAPELLVMYALEKFYEVSRTNRFVRIAGSLEELAQAVKPVNYEEEEARASAARLVRTEDQRRRFGLREAAAELARAEKHHTIASVLRRCLAQDFERVLVFVLDEVKARAWGQSGCRIPAEVVRDGVDDPLRSIAVPIDESLLFRHAKRKESVFLDTVSDLGVDQIIVRILKTEPDESVFVLPVRRGEETLCVGIGAGPREARSFEKTSHYRILGDKLSDAIEIVRLRKRILDV